MLRLLRDPRRHAPWYNATGTTLYVLGMLVIYEGVEDPVQLDLLATAGEGYVQGFAVAAL